MVLTSKWGRIQPGFQIWADQVVAASWTLVRSPKHAEKMLIQLITPTEPSSPAVQCAGRKHRSRPSLLRCGDRVICSVVFYFYILVMFEAQPLPLQPTLKPQFGNSFEKGWLKPGGQMQSSFYMDGCERFSVSGRCRCCMFCDFCDTRLQPPAQNLCSGAVMMLLDVVPQID